MAPQLGPYTFDGLNDVQALPAPFAPVEYLIQVIGTSTQTIELQDSLDGGTTYVAVGLVNVSTGAAAANITAAGLYRFSPGVLRAPRLFNTAFTSGSFAIRVVATLRS